LWEEEEGRSFDLGASMLPQVQEVPKPDMECEVSAGSCMMGLTKAAKYLTGTPGLPS